MWTEGRKSHTLWGENKRKCRGNSGRLPGFLSILQFLVPISAWASAISLIFKYIPVSSNNFQFFVDQQEKPSCFWSQESSAPAEEWAERVGWDLSPGASTEIQPWCMQLAFLAGTGLETQLWVGQMSLKGKGGSWGLIPATQSMWLHILSPRQTAMATPKTPRFSNIISLWLWIGEWWLLLTGQVVKTHFLSGRLHSKGGRVIHLEVSHLLQKSYFGKRTVCPSICS